MIFANKLRAIAFLLILIGFSSDSTASCTDPNDKKCKRKKPNIIVIVADDMGWNDVSIHGSNQIPTPNIDALGVFGIQLNRMYVAPMCTPTRSSLMTGKYESNVGMQHFVIPSDAPYGLGLDQKILPEYMKDAGYKTSIVGKWHLGFHQRRYTPLFRGFDSHFGYLGPFIDYFQHNLVKRSPVSNQPINGYDMRRNLSVHWETRGTYATDLFTDKAIEEIEGHDKEKPLFMYVAHLAPHAGNENEPLQAPPDEIEKFAYIKDEKRRKYAATVSKLDQSVGRIVKALNDNDMLNNSIILFFSDNGSPVIGEHANSGSNLPFKGQKDSPWEGAVRSSAAIWSPLLSKRQRVSNQLVHVSDWLPTFAKIAGVTLQGHVDGKNVWSSLSHDLPSPRREVLNHFDEIEPYAALVVGDYKIVSGTTYNGTYDDWLSASDISEENEQLREDYATYVLSSTAGKILQKYEQSSADKRIPELSPELSTHTKIRSLRRAAKVTCNGYQRPINEQNETNPCRPLQAPCLFNVMRDPCETTNLANEMPQIVSKLNARMDYLGSFAVPTRNRPSDPRADPAQFNGTWTWWFDELGIKEPVSSSNVFTTCNALQLFFILVVATTVTL